MRSLLVAALAAAPILNSNVAQDLISLLHAHPFYFYFALVWFACGEGPILSVISGTLIKLGFFSFWPVYIALMFGDLIGDMLWYAIGYYFGRTFVKRFGIRFGTSDRKIQQVSRLFRRHRHKVLLINKITMGFGFSIATLLSAGIAKIPFGQYMAVNAIGQFVWTGILIALGFFVGNAYVYISEIFGVLGNAGLIGMLILIAYAMHRYRGYMAGKVATSGTFMGMRIAHV